MPRQGYIPAFVRAKIAAHKITKANRGKKKTKPGTIRYPENHSEFEIQSFLYAGLRDRGYDARGEICTNTGVAKFDIVIFKDKKAIRIIECKKRKVSGHSKRKNDLRELTVREIQMAKYKRYNLPVDTVCGMDAAIDYLASTAVLAADPIRINKIAAQWAKAECVNF